MSESVAVELQAAVLDVQIVRSMTDDQYAKMAECKKTTALHTMWGPVVIDPFSYAVLSGKEDVVILGSPTLAALGIDVYDSFGECARKRNLSVQGVESPNFKECRRMSIAVEALLQRGPGATDLPDDAVERLVSRGPDMCMEPEQEERERAVALAKAVETAVAYGLSAGGGVRLREILNRHWNVSRRGFRGDPPGRVELLTVTFKPGVKVEHPLFQRLRGLL